MKVRTGFLNIKKDEPYFDKISFPFTKESIREKLENNLSHLVLEVTQNCNFRCRYCVYSGSYKHERTHSPVNMSEEVALKALEFLRKRSRDENTIRIGFYGGEPLLNFKLIKFIVLRASKIFKDKKVRFSLTTNGALLKDHIIEYLVDHKIFTFVSIDGPEEVHDRYRVDLRGNGTFKNIVTNLKNFKKRFPEFYNKHVGFVTVLSPPFQLKKVLEFFNNWELKTDAPHFITLVDPVNTDFYTTYMKPEDREKYKSEYRALAREELERFIKTGEPGKFSDFLIYLKDLINFHNRKMGKIGSTLFLSGFCIPGHDRVFVTPDGSLYPCEKVHTHFKIGDLLQGFYFDKIFRVIDRIVQIRDKMGCRSCWLGRLCSMCFANIMRNEEVRKDLIRKECQINQNKWQTILEYYIEIFERNPKALEKLKL